MNEPAPRPSLSVVIPAMDEETSIAGTIEGVAEVLNRMEVVHEIIVVNDGSHDDTALRAKAAGAEVVNHNENKGYGASLKTGVRVAQAPWVLILDADGTYPPAEVESLLKHANGQDVIVGARTKSTSKDPAIRRPMKWLLKRLAERLSNRSIPDLNSGMRLFGREDFLIKSAQFPDGFSITTTHTLTCLSENRNVKFVPIHYERRSGHSKFHPIRDTWGMTLLIVKTVMMFDPMRVFLPVSFLLLSGAVLVAGLTLTVFPPFLDTTFVVLLFAALQFFALGLLADLINRRR